MINMLRALMEKVDNMHEKVATFSIEMETKGKESVDKWKTGAQVTNSFDRLIHKLKTAEEKISELEDRPIEITPVETQRKTTE